MAAPEDAQAIIDKLGEDWFSHIVTGVDEPDPRPSKPRPRGYRLRPSTLDKLHSGLSKLRRRLPRISNAAALADAKATWATILNRSTAVENLRLPSLEDKPDDRWPAAAAAATARAQALLVANDTKKRAKFIAMKIDDREALRLDAFESGAQAPFLNKFKTVAKRSSIQVPTSTGGFTTSPEAIKEQFSAVMVEWLRSRRSAPPVHLPLHEELYGDLPPGEIDATAPLTPAELRHSLRQVPKGSAPGPSGVTAELLRLLSLWCHRRKSGRRRKESS